MNKEEALNNFLNGLRITLHNTSAYHSQHPYFRKSASDFKQRIDVVFNFLNPIKIKITPNSLFIDDRYWEKSMLYVELAQVFHLRKIKSIEFVEGLTVEELMNFFSSVSGPSREIFRQGGIINILNREKHPHIFVEELDYSELLRDEGEESKDIWVYLLGDALEKEDFHKLNNFADNFEKIIGKFKAKDLYENDELRLNSHNFMTYLKNINEDRFKSCTKALLKLFLRDKNIVPEEKLEKIRMFFKDLNKDDFAEILWEEITKNEEFNYLSFKTFIHLVEKGVHDDIAPALENKIKNTDFVKTNPKIRKKIKELFSVSEISFISPLYRKALYWLAEDNLLENRLVFDRELAQINYRFLLLNLLLEEQDKERLGLISRQLLKEADKVIAKKDLGYRSP